MRPLWSLTGLLAAADSPGKGGATLVFVMTILVVLGLLGSVVWRASRTPPREEDTIEGATNPEPSVLPDEGEDPPAPTA
jgi:hypothetical protein